MALELKDIRGKVPIEVWALIKGMATAQRKDESEAIRDVLTNWYDTISHATRVADDHLRVAGILGNIGEKR